jgi:hypothetical protein
VLKKFSYKDEIKKAFGYVKNWIGMKRQRNHHSSTTDGKIYCAFISLIGVIEIGNKLNDLLKNKVGVKLR